jgi:hypothetical protein
MLFQFLKIALDALLLPLVPSLRLHIPGCNAFYGDDQPYHMIDRNRRTQSVPVSGSQQTPPRRPAALLDQRQTNPKFDDTYR